MANKSLHHDHTPESIAFRLAQEPDQSYLRDWVYGGIDGTVTTFAVVSGVMGASLSLRTILILGFANIIADGFSMAVSNYMGTQAEVEEWERLAQFEHEQTQKNPEGEIEEVRQILIRKGFTGDLLERAVEMMTTNREVWIHLMLQEEYGLPRSVRSPKKAALSTLSSFVLCGLVPLLPFLIQFESAFFMACILTGLIFFTIGSLKARWSLVTWWRSGISTLFIGAAAAALAYVTGYFLRDVG